jgi:anaerobic selenocysteine-containing dehydrogenase
MEEKKLPDVLKHETSRRDFLRGTATAAGGAIAITAMGSIAPRKAEAQYSVQTAPGTKPFAQKFLYAGRANCTGCRSC